MQPLSTTNREPAKPLEFADIEEGKMYTVIKAMIGLPPGRQVVCKAKKSAYMHLVGADGRGSWMVDKRDPCHLVLDVPTSQRAAEKPAENIQVIAGERTDATKALLTTPSAETLTSQIIPAPRKPLSIADDGRIEPLSEADRPTDLQGLLDRLQDIYCQTMLLMEKHDVALALLSEELKYFRTLMPGLKLAAQMSGDQNLRRAEALLRNLSIFLGIEVAETDS